MDLRWGVRQEGGDSTLLQQVRDCTPDLQKAGVASTVVALGLRAKP